MKEYVNYNSVVVNLEPTANAQTEVKLATYEQAFLGEKFSDAKGRGRQRRKARKLERISSRREVGTGRRKIKGDRQDERIARRSKRKTTKQDARSIRKDRRMEAKENRNPEEEEDVEEETTQQNEDDEDTGTESGYQSGDSQEDEEDTSSDTAENDTSDEADDEADESFAGDSSNFSSEVTGKPSVPMAIQKICDRIENHNERISQLLQHKKMLESKGKDTSKINVNLASNFDDAQNLEAQLEDFSNAGGKRNRQKVSAVKIAKRKARLNRIANLPIPPVMLYKLLKQGKSKDEIKQWWEAKGRKRQASKRNFDGTTDDYGVTPDSQDYMDYSEGSLPAYEYDNIQPEIIDLDSPTFDPKINFGGGGSSNTFWRSLLIGGLIAFAGVYVIRKYKLLK